MPSKRHFGWTIQLEEIRGKLVRAFPASEIGPPPFGLKNAKF